jgi:4-hydroxybenzoate polyprenyltransferase
MQLMRLPGTISGALILTFGAISVENYSISVLVPLFIVGILSGIYGFVLNDYIDADLDKLCKDLSKRALVRGTVSKKAARIIIILCFLGAYITIFLFFYRPHTLFFTGLICILVADALCGIYNVYGKRILGSDFFLALAQSLFFLFGALMVLEHGTPGGLTWVLFLLIFLQLLYSNAIIGGLKDADHDYLMNVKNIALASGVIVEDNQKLVIPSLFLAFGLGLRFLSAFFVFAPFFFFNVKYELIQIVILIPFVVLLLLSSSRMLTFKQFNRRKLRKVIIVQVFLWYCIVPLLFVSIIGWFSAFLLVALPTAWYFFFSFLIGEKLFEPQI